MTTLAAPNRPPNTKQLATHCWTAHTTAYWLLTSAFCPASEFALPFASRTSLENSRVYAYRQCVTSGTQHNLSKQCQQHLSKRCQLSTWRSFLLCLSLTGRKGATQLWYAVFASAACLASTGVLVGHKPTAELPGCSQKAVLVLLPDQQAALHASKCSAVGGLKLHSKPGHGLLCVP